MTMSTDPAAQPDQKQPDQESQQQQQQDQKHSPQQQGSSNDAQPAKKRGPQRHEVPKSILDTDEFKMYCFKVLPCPNQRQHDWKSCPFAHSGEKAARRDVRKQPYLGIFCDNLKEDEDAVCPRGDACPFAHNVFELWLHPTRYRTQLCRDGLGCKRKVCFFAHSLDDLRSPQAAQPLPPAQEPLIVAGLASSAQLAPRASIDLGGVHLGSMHHRASMDLGAAQVAPRVSIDFSSLQLAQRASMDMGPRASLDLGSVALPRASLDLGGGGQEALLAQLQLLQSQPAGMQLDQQLQMMMLQQQEQQQQQVDANVLLQAQALLQQQQQQQQLASMSAAPDSAFSSWAAGIQCGGFPPRSSAPTYAPPSSAFGAASNGFGGHSEAAVFGGFSRSSFTMSRQSLDIPRRSLHQVPPRRSLDVPMQRSSLDMPMPYGPGGLSSSVTSSQYSLASSIASYNQGGSTTSYTSSLGMRQGSGYLVGGSSAMHISQRPSNLSLATLEEEGASGSCGPPAVPVDAWGSQLAAMSALYAPSSAQQQQQQQQLSGQQLAAQSSFFLPAAATTASHSGQELAAQSSLFMPATLKQQQQQLSGQQLAAQSSFFAPTAMAPQEQQQQQQQLGSPTRDCGSDGSSSGFLTSPASTAAAAAAGLGYGPLRECSLEALEQQQQLLRSSLLGLQQQVSEPAAAQPQQASGLPDIPESVMQMLAAVRLYNQQQAGRGQGAAGVH